MIEVRLFATFREGRKKVYHLDPENIKVAGDILNLLNIPFNEVAILLINGRHSKPADKVKDSDILAIFPPVGGG